MPASASSPDEVLRIKTGRLGPLRPCEVAFRPLTVLIGKQGTGKSLVAQLSYLFRALPSLAEYDAAQQQRGEATDAKASFRRIIDGLRSRNRSFANLTQPNVTIEWKGPIALNSVHSTMEELGFNAQHVTRAVIPRKATLRIVRESQQKRQYLAALFTPTERVVYSLGLGASGFRVLPIPLVLEYFGHWMETVASRIQEDWPDGRPATPEGRWIRDRALRALEGEAIRVGSSWKWTFTAERAHRRIDLDMASSGQRANWPLFLIPQVIFDLKATGQIARDFTLYVEEPEIHLHPAAERLVIEVLAYLVNHGIRVVLTTHSLTVLYTLNNLLKAAQLPSGIDARGLPEHELRLEPHLVAAWHLHDGRVASLIDHKTGLIDEAALGSVADELSQQFNMIATRLVKAH
jgi:hypothetical protein